MKVEISSFENAAFIPHEYALGVPAVDNPATFGQNINPNIKWSDIPDGTKSFAILCVDPDVPSKPDDVNKEDREVPSDLPRVDFYHWVLVDIPSDRTEIAEGEDSNGVTQKGKPIGKTSYGKRGYNNYTQWFDGDENMQGYYGGYDGPFPPWNDSIIHRYVFEVYALDVENLNVGDIFSGDDAKKAMDGHILGKAEWMGKYTLNKRLLK